MRAQPMTAFKGVRSSCESVARNSSFKRFALSASLRAARSLSNSSASRSSARFRSVISRATCEAPSRVFDVLRAPERDMEGLATLLGNHIPAYKNLMTSYSALTRK